MLDDIINTKLQKIMRKVDTEQEVQSIIHPDLMFKRNSINMLLSRRGVGKTFTVLRELGKLCLLPDYGGYSQFIYVSDKQNDSTVNHLLSLIKFAKKIVEYANAEQVLKQIAECKTAYLQVKNKHLESKLTDESRANILGPLDVTDFDGDVPNSAILFDDAMNILGNTKFKNLRNLLFQNRQPRFTIFICLQDNYGIPPQIKRNADTVWLFAGFTDMTMFGFMLRQLGCPFDSKEIWKMYSQLNKHDALILDKEDVGTSVRIYKAPVLQTQERDDTLAFEFY
jgi:hypothetical protein